MIKLVCAECNGIWYTSNTVNLGDCDYCHGQLIEVDVKLSDDNVVGHIDVNKEIAWAFE